MPDPGGGIEVGHFPGRVRSDGDAAWGGGVVGRWRGVGVGDAHRGPRCPVTGGVGGRGVSPVDGVGECLGVDGDGSGGQGEAEGVVGGCVVGVGGFVGQDGAVWGLDVEGGWGQGVVGEVGGDGCGGDGWRGWCGCGVSCGGVFGGFVFEEVGHGGVGGVEGPGAVDEAGEFGVVPASRRHHPPHMTSLAGRWLFRLDTGMLV